MLWKIVFLTGLLICNSAAAQPLLKKPTCSIERAEELLALNAYHEARGEGWLGMYAVTSTAMQRVHSDNYPDDICSVILEPSRKRESPSSCQFSWSCDHLSNNVVKAPKVPMRQIAKPKDGKAWIEAKRIARLALMGVYGVAKAGKPATIYYNCNTRKKPKWDWTKLQFVGKIGQQCFYAEK